MKGADVGDLIAKALTLQGSTWTGKMRSPETGWTFQGTIAETRKGQLAVKGCAGPICVKQIWYSTKSLRRLLE